MHKKMQDKRMPLLSLISLYVAVLRTLLHYPRRYKVVGWSDVGTIRVHITYIVRVTESRAFLSRPISQPLLLVGIKSSIQQRRRRPTTNQYSILRLDPTGSGLFPNPTHGQTGESILSLSFRSLFSLLLSVQIIVILSLHFRRLFLFSSPRLFVVAFCPHLVRCYT